MAPNTVIESSLANPLATADQLTSSGSQLDSVPAELETSAIFLGARLTQFAGILLRLQQDTIAQAIVIFTRFWIGPEGGSLREYSVKVQSQYLESILASNLIYTGCFCGITLSSRKTIFISKVAKEHHQRSCVH